MKADSLIAVFIRLVPVMQLCHGWKSGKLLELTGPHLEPNVLYHPQEDLGGTTTVGCSLVVQDIVSAREGTLQARFQFLVWIEMKWVDGRLQWDTMKSNMTTKHLPINTLWIPELKLLNGLDPNLRIDKSLRATVQSNGLVTLQIPASTPVHCSHHRSPTASWRCRLIFGSWTYNILDMNLIFSKEERYSGALKYGKWYITAIEATRYEEYHPWCLEPFVELEYELFMLRY